MSAWYCRPAPLLGWTWVCVEVGERQCSTNLREWEHTPRHLARAIKRLRRMIAQPNGSKQAEGK